MELTVPMPDSDLVDHWMRLYDGDSFLMRYTEYIEHEAKRYFPDWRVQAQSHSEHEAWLLRFSWDETPFGGSRGQHTLVYFIGSDDDFMGFREIEADDNIKWEEY